jgi:hypothetical protein
MEAGRQPGMLQGLSRFLVQHERCEAGFDVAHPAGLGSGRVTITCRGCGARHEYATATIDLERELSAAGAPEETRPGAPEPAPAAPSEAPAIPPRPAPYPDAAPGPAPDREPATVRRARPAVAREAPARRGATAEAPGGVVAAPPPRGRAVALRRFLSSPGFTLLMAVIAAGALVFALVQSIGDGDEAPVTTTQPPASAAAPPQEPPEVPSEIPAPAAGARAQLATTTLRTERYTIEVPRGWTRRFSNGSVLLEPRGGGRVNVQIYYEQSPGLSRDEMARRTTEFMTGQVPGAALFPRTIEIGGRRAFEITARGPGETAIAVDVLRGPYRFLLVRRIFAGAKPHSSRAAGRVVSSFRPL